MLMPLELKGNELILLLSTIFVHASKRVLQEGYNE